ncbi:hypothetical protein [Tenacibaculum amylolyticum]|uniref:hypothetical protein n=1 Tax=Tenacibaculum amylolyticum TaxID=104269 RepID=UPI003895B40A
MNKSLIYILCFIFYKNVTAQTNTHQSEYINDVIESMVSHFEDTLCEYYNIDKESSHIAIAKFVEDSSKSFKRFDGFDKLINKKSKALLANSKKELDQYVWITHKKRRHRATPYLKSYSELEPLALKELDSNTVRYLKYLETKDKFITINYFDKFSKNIIRNVYNQDIEDLILTFRETPDSGPSLVATALKNLTPLDFQNKAIKTFIAFELYYSLLNLQSTYE